MAAVKTGDDSLGPASSSSDAHRSFCDLFEEDEALLTTAGLRREDDAAEAAAASAAEGAEPTTASSNRGRTNIITAAAADKAGEKRVGGEKRELVTGTGAAATSRFFFEGAAAAVRRGLVGRNAPFRTPYGMKPLVYSDWTATGRAVDCIEVSCVFFTIYCCLYVQRCRLAISVICRVGCGSMQRESSTAHGVPKCCSKEALQQ